MAQEAIRQLRRTSNVRRLDTGSDFLVLDGQDVTDDEARALIDQGVRTAVRQAIDRITGRVD
jgi:hypothetical protein